MTLAKTVLMGTSLMALAACGGGGGGVLSGGGVPGTTLTEVFRAEPSGSLLIDPEAVDMALRGDTSEHTASNVQGVSGVIATATFLDATPDLRDVFMTMNNDRTELTLTIQGLGTVVLPVVGNTSEFSAMYGDFFEETISLSHFDSRGRAQYSDSTSPGSSIIGVGYYGLETPLDRLPTGSDTLTYSGSLDALAYVSSFSAPTGIGADATFNMALDFSDNSISGLTDGRVFYSTGAGLVEDNATGSITGVISGNGIGGTFTLNGSASSANLVFEGNMFGWDAEQIGGGLIGTITGGGSSNPVYGEFDGDLED